MMKKRLATLACALLVACVALPAGAANLPAPGTLAATREMNAIAGGLQVRTETTFAWGGLPLLDEDANSALKSLLRETKLVQRRQRADDGSYWAWDLMLRGVSVLDIASHLVDGVYYEQSNLLGGQVTAFTQEEFSTFVARVSAKSQGSLPPNLDMVYQAVVRALAGDPDALSVDLDTLDGGLAAFAQWQATALTEIDRLRPTLYIPGLYGAHATVISVTREEMIQLAQAYSDLLAENDALWREAAEVQSPGADEAQIAEEARRIADTMRALPGLLAEFLPEDLRPAEYRLVYDSEETLIARQLEISLPEDMYVYLEWVTEAEGVPTLYMSLSVADSSLDLLLTHEVGAPESTRANAKRRDKTLAQATYIQPELQVDAVMTRTEDIDTRLDRETRSIRTEWMLESEALLGEGALVTLSAQTRDTASGETYNDYTRKVETIYRVDGLGFDGQDILTTTARTKVAKEAGPALAAEEAVRPAQLDEEAFDDWLEGTQVSLRQVGFTVLGRLPADVAAYLLELLGM